MVRTISTSQPEALFGFTVTPAGSGSTDPGRNPATPLRAPNGYTFTDPSEDTAVEGIAAPDSPVEEIGPHVDTRERARLLLGALNMFTYVSQAEGFKKSQNTPEVRGRYGAATEDVARGMEVKQRNRFLLARELFLKAYNLGTSVPSDGDSKDQEFKQAFDKFSQKYGVGATSKESERKAENRENLRRVLRRIALIPDPQQTNKSAWWLAP